MVPQRFNQKRDTRKRILHRGRYGTGKTSRILSRVLFWLWTTTMQLPSLFCLFLRTSPLATAHKNTPQKQWIVRERSARLKNQRCGVIEDLPSQRMSANLMIFSRETRGNGLKDHVVNVMTLVHVKLYLSLSPLSPLSLSFPSPRSLSLSEVAVRPST